MKASVIICTYNRSDLLGDSIRAIQNQDYPADSYEILVVDNNSSDSTKEVALALVPGSRVDIRYIFEARQGLSHARNTGIAHAKGEILAFIDDDIDAPRDWLKSITHAFQNQEVVAAGGPIRPIWPFKKPDWLTESWQGFFTINEYQKARELGEFRPPHYPWGANMAFRKNVVSNIGFSTDLGRVGNSLLSCEEKSLFQKIYETGGVVAFAPNAVIHHKIPASRLNKLWLYHRTYWQGRSNAVIDLNDNNEVYSNLLNALLVLSDKSTSRQNTFDHKCRGKEAFGYLFQVLTSDARTGDFKKIRALLVLLRATLGRERCTPADARENRAPEDLNRYTQELLRQKDAQIDALLNSGSWKITSPLRYGFDLFNKIKMNFKS